MPSPGVSSPGAGQSAGNGERAPLRNTTAVFMGSEGLRTTEFEPTSYDATLVITIKDCHSIKAQQHLGFGLHVARMMAALLLLWSLITIQVYLLGQIKIFVASPAVRSIRKVYDQFERHMYNGQVKESDYGFALGIGGPHGIFFDPMAFQSFPDKGTICQIPFSQYNYIAIILFIWSLTVVGELKSAVNQAWWVANLEKCPLEQALMPAGEDGQMVWGLPTCMKIFIIVVLVLPRILIASILCWLGCRWLSATLDFQEVLINGVALEFVIRLNELLFESLMSSVNKREIAEIKMSLPPGVFDKPNVWSFFGTFMWGVVAFAWVTLYLNKIQMVLPGYQWDIREVCNPWISERYSFWRL